MVRLIVKKYDGREEIFSSLESETLIGRDDPTSGIINHINFSDNTVSRHHAKIYFEQHYFYIEDMDSSNGTWVNEHRIKKVKLLPGDKVSIGRNIIIFESEGTRTLNPLDFIVDEEKLDHKKSEEAVKQVLSQKISLLVGYDFEASTTMINRGVHSAICAPILKEPRVYGVIYLEDPLPGRFGEEELVILTLFANQLAAGIENHHHFQ
ncbi:MAG: FHA domain-containing protein [Syntrophobacterales bacterium]